ncbi:MAG: ROK family protein [Pirellulales bacterium]|nr:ROK family protein [Pirellulales bacterium]
MSVLACDLGGTRIKLGVVENGRLLASEVLTSQSDQGLGQALDRIADGLVRLCNSVGTTPQRCRGIGMGFPALVDGSSGRVLNEYGRYSDAPRIDLQRWGTARFGLPVALENDARLALLGEWSYGAARGSNNVAIITLGTGIGSGVMSQGKLLRGPHFQAGNLCGHMIIRIGGYRCVCGAHGCVEAETGSIGLAARARESREFETSKLAAEPEVNYESVFRCAAAEDDLAIAMVNHACNTWGAMCVNMIQAFDLDRIVIGGGVMASADMILPRVRGYVEENVFATWGRVEIVAAHHPDHMALLGCEALLAEWKGS